MHVPSVGRHPCLWCTISASEMQKPKSLQKRCISRTLDNLNSSHESFQKAGGDIKKVKNFNVLTPPMFNVEISQVQVHTYTYTYTFRAIHTYLASCAQVCIPGLHISLGVFYKLFTLLEAAAHELDILIAITIGRDPSHHQPDQHEFGEYVRELQKISALREEVDDLFDHADFCDCLAHWNLLDSEEEKPDPHTEALRKEAREARQKAEKLVIYSH